ncbi:DNA cytosine methyltransferase [Candidatus Woesearchaeota archaeon]|nr:DNA cytosine methyltransferase [Candidatus Woesearchaeota archaeon]
MRSKPTVIDFFAGAGGISLGFKKAGFEILAANDIDKHCKETYNKNFPKVPCILKDIRNLTANEIFQVCGTDQIDVVVGGPACQGFSLANIKTRTADNPKNNLVFEFIRLVKDIRPSWFIMENVEGLIHMNNGSFTNSIIKNMRRHGYSIDFISLCAADYGVPQKRKRVFFIGNRIGKKIEIPKKKFGTEKKPHITVEEALGDLPEIDNQTGGYAFCEYTTAPKNKYQKKMRGRSKSVHNHLITKSSKLILERYSRIPPGKNWSALPDSLKSKCVKESGGHSYLYKRLEPNSPANTIANFRKAMMIHPFEDRGLSVREAARLQSFNDSFVFTGGISSQQQQLANVVPPLLAQAIGAQIIKTL